MNIMEIDGIECYENNGTAYLKLETVARGSGFTRKAKSGNEVIRWETVRKHLNELGVPTSWHENSQPVGKEGLPDFIPENVFYRLAMKAKNKVAEAFQAKIADEVIPSIRRTGSYGVPNDIAQTMTLLAESVNLLNQRIEQMENRISQPALPARFEAAKAMEKKRWTRLVNKKLDLITEIVDFSRNEILHMAYRYVEQCNNVDLNEERLKYMDATGEDGTVIETIYANGAYRASFEYALNYYLPESCQAW